MGEPERAVSAVKIEPHLIGGVLDVPYWEIWDEETQETLNREPILDEPDLTAAMVLARFMEEYDDR